MSDPTATHSDRTALAPPDADASPAARLLRRLGLEGGNTELRLAWSLLLAFLLVYATSMLAFYPQVATNDDEAKYIRQARLVLEGTTELAKEDALTGEITRFRPSQYPPGMALLMAPFIFVAGFPGAFVAPLLALLLGVAFTGRWLQCDGHSPVFALLMVGFPSCLVLGRVPMSDVPSLAAVALGMWLFWRGLDRGTVTWLAAGFVAGLSMMLRKTNALLFAPLFAGTVLRGEKRSWALVVGGVVGVSLRLLASYLAFDDPLYVKAPYQVALATVHERLPIYLLGLLVFVPGGLVLALAYRGRRQPEIVVTIVAFCILYTLQPYGIMASSFAKRIVIALRYFVPLLPLLAFAMAESVPRLWSAWMARSSESARPLLRGAFVGLLVLYLAGLLTAAAVTHFAFDRWSATQAKLRDAMFEHAPPDSVLVTNIWATKKFAREFDRKFVPIDRDEITREELGTLVDRHGGFYIALLDRTDSLYWRSDVEKNAAFLRSLEPPPSLVADVRATPTDRLRVWQVAELEPPPPAEAPSEAAP